MLCNGKAFGKAVTLEKPEGRPARLTELVSLRTDTQDLEHTELVMCIACHYLSLAR